MTSPIEKSDSNNIPQPLGLVPLYPFPPLVDRKNSDVKKQSQSLVHSGATFLPPLFNYYFGIDALEQNANDVSELVLKEVVAEEILDVYEQLFTDGGEFLDEALEREAQQKEAQQDRVSKSLAKEVLEEVLNVACRETVLDVLDDMITDHADEMKSRLMTDHLLNKYEDEFLEEIVSEVLEICTCGETCMLMVHEVIQEEANSVVEEVLMQYGAQVAFQQYKQITKFAADYTLDGICQQILLPRNDSASATEDMILDHIVVDILLNKALELDKCHSQEKCIPLQWYRKKLVRNVVLGDTLDELCQALDDQLLGDGNP